MNKNETAFEVVLKKSYTVEDLEDILSCMFSDSGYWCRVDNTTPLWVQTREKLRSDGTHKFGPTYEEIMREILLSPNGEIILEEIDDAGETEEVHHLTLEKLKTGIAMFMERQEDLAVDWNGDTIDMDGEVGDCVLQYAVFGEIVYG